MIAFCWSFIEKGNKSRQRNKNNISHSSHLVKNGAQQSGRSNRNNNNLTGKKKFLWKCQTFYLCYSSCAVTHCLYKTETWLSFRPTIAFKVLQKNLTIDLTGGKRATSTNTFNTLHQDLWLDEVQTVSWLNSSIDCQAYFHYSALS